MAAESTTDNATAKLAVLIDADNTPPRGSGTLLTGSYAKDGSGD